MANLNLALSNFSCVISIACLPLYLRTIVGCQRLPIQFADFRSDPEGASPLTHPPAC